MSKPKTFQMIFNNMDTFKKLFGISHKQIKTNVILFPFFNKTMKNAFGVNSLKKGALYKSACTEKFSLIQTGIGPSFVGDAVLHLQKSPCQNIILFGACGDLALKSPLKIGDLLSVKKCYDCTSFSRLLSNDLNGLKERSSSKSLLEKSLKSVPPLKAVTCISMGSLFLEKETAPQLKKLNADVVDMETAVFYQAAAHTGRDPLALLFVTDRVGDRPFFIPKTSSEAQSIKTAIDKAPAIIENILNA